MARRKLALAQGIEQDEVCQPDFSTQKDYSFKPAVRHRSSMSCIHALGFVGASVYFISQASGFWMGVLGVLKAIVWPAFLVYEALMWLGA